MQRLMGNLSKGLTFVISAPAGTGKTTLTQKLVKEFPCVVQSISFTTRSKRGKEVDGVHYNFISKQDFEMKIKNDEFLEYAEIYGELYGTSRSWVEEHRNRGLHVILVIDTQGGIKLKGNYDASFIFIMPPSLDALRDRLSHRKTETAEAMERRLRWARKEIETGKEHYEYIIVNQDLEVAYQTLKSIIIAEEHRAKNLIN